MRKALLPLALLLIAIPAHAADFSGQWSLDKTQSKDLPPFYEEVKAHSLKITQDEKELVVAVEITSDAHEPLHIDFKYRLDGQPTKTESQIRTPDGPMSVPTILTAKPQDDGTLAITIERELPSRGGETMKGSTVEKWRLQPDGKTLIIDRVDEMRRGTTTSTLIFKRDARSSGTATQR
ncbi:MAG: hypothetical protein ACJ74H_17630 [Thermoanaerobaculia bacterium]